MNNESDHIEANGSRKGWISRAWEVLRVSLMLGLTSFGGPTAHLGYFHHEYVKKKQWLDEKSYADLVALCQFLPGPASSQVGIGIGVMRAGVGGGVAAWLGFTLPSAVALVILALLFQHYDLMGSGWIQGLKLTAVAIVAHAVFGMGQKLAAGRSRATIAVLAAAAALFWQTAFSQVAIIVVAGFVGWYMYRGVEDKPVAAMRLPISRRTAIICLILFLGLLAMLPVVRAATESQLIAVFDSFYRSGSLVFGGGHVVLPLLEREMLTAGWLTQEQFLAGYGATQAVPGPLFTFAAYLGAVMDGWFGAVVATLAIFLPAFLLVIGVLPFWDGLRRLPWAQGALQGINAAVVGILLAALYDPIWVRTVGTTADFILAAILFVILQYWKLPPWFVVIIGAIGGVIIHYQA